MRLCCIFVFLYCKICAQTHILQQYATPDLTKQIPSYADHLIENWPAVALWFAAGSFDGLADVVKNHYSQSVFSGRCDNFCNPAISWQRKYKNWPEDQRAAYPGAKTWLSWSTDLWHGAKSARKNSALTAVFVFKAPIEGKALTRKQRKARLKYLLIDAAVISVSYSAGWHITNRLLK